MLGHIISFYSAPAPRLVFWNGDEAQDIPLEGECSATFSAHRMCIGHLDAETRHRCPHRARGWKQCPECAGKDISHIYTCLDFRGYEQMEGEYCRQEFSVYVAQFGNEILKCGVTRTERLEQRLMEQGADFWAEAARFTDGHEAYATEGRLQRAFGFSNAVRSADKLRLLHDRPDGSLLASRLAGMAMSEAFAPMLLPSAAVKRIEYPVPNEFSISESICGEITGSKAKLLFYRSGGKDFVVDMARNDARFFTMKE